MIDRNDKNSEKKEIDFEIKYLTSLTTAQRFKMMFDISFSIAKRLKKYGNRTSYKITQRI